MSSPDPPSPEYRDVFDSAPGNFLLLDPTLTIVGVTDAYCAATMTVRAQILGRHIFDVFPDNPSDPAATGVRNLRASLDRVLGHRKPDRMPLQRYDIRRPASEGGGFEERYWSPLNSPVLGSDGRLRQIIHAVEDVTELVQLKRKMQEDENLLRAELRQSENQIEAEMYLRVEAIEANKRLGESERRYRFLADAVPQLIWTADATGAATYFNGRWFEFTGMALEQLKGGGWWSVIHPEDVEQTARAWEQAVRDGADRYQVEHRLRRHDGLYRRMFTVAQPYRDPNGAVLHWFGSTTDIHDRAIAEEQLRQAQRLQSVGKLAGGMAHEVNNMMTVVIGSASFALGELDPGSAVYNDIQEIIGAANRATEVTRQLLAYSRQQVLRPTVLDVNEVIEQLTGTLERLLGTDRQLIVRPSPEQARVRADRTQIDQVLINLAANARDATTAGGVISIEVDAVEFDGAGGEPQGAEGAAGDFVRIAVKDDGIGMSADVLARVFEPFFTTKPLGAGTGLGLSMVYGIVNQSGGFARIDSTPGLGTMVAVYLPLVREALTTEEAATEAPRGEGESILVVEDELKVRTLAARALLSYGYTVYEAPNGVAALQFLATQLGQIDLVLTDIVMPGMTGQDLARSIHDQHPNLPILCMSGYTGDEMTARGIMVHGVPFIQKPFTLAALARAVRKVLTHAGDLATLGARDLSQL
jgi:two-component system cell cycle sensor histidine kinase/response regulator CckA